MPDRTRLLLAIIDIILILAANLTGSFHLALVAAWLNGFLLARIPLNQKF